jgi:hypothetical protein
MDDTIGRRRWYWEASAEEFRRTESTAILGQLVLHHPFDVDSKQSDAWLHQIEHLKLLASAITRGHFFLEFSIPRMGKRADAILLAGGIVFVLEYKVGAGGYWGNAADQVLDYALDLKNFHAGSHDRTIVPILIATDAPAVISGVKPWSDDVARPLLANSETLAPLIKTALSELGSHALDDPLAWARSSYKPTPTIVEAAQALYQGHDVREISRSEAGKENLSRTALYIARVIEQAKQEQRKAICFVTGVPGSGKTLAGLNLATERMRTSEEEHAVFLSGNAPLVAVLREALAQDEVERSQLAGQPTSKKDAMRHASTFIQNIHHFRDEYVGNNEVPIERVVVFDEAQRAWTEEQTSKFMKERGHNDFDMSEPDFLLSAMNRHRGWCVVVCLVGGGQEINTGEAGLGEWFTAIQKHYRDWDVHMSDQLTGADYLGKDAEYAVPKATQNGALHLAVSVRSFRAEAASEFVGAVVAGDASAARISIRKLSQYALVLTRDLESARVWLRNQARGTERIGLVASSNGIRLKPVGVFVKAKIDPPTWFLAGKDDVRSSYALEDVATEFDIQGLELDWVGMCWDANFRREDNVWKPYYFRGARWERVQDPTRAAYLANAHRVLLTRARQGMVILVPRGTELDQTRPPSFYDETFSFLTDCGIPQLR